ncbi:MAG TPA: sigma-70 family RNA polymerase sigma factor [Candidatus Nanoarchaeia archaeon]|nr:sigma-70 family RNA polymerase sigma factor [Candidatus Nanoarchaeia archaeon]
MAKLSLNELINNYDGKDLKRLSRDEEIILAERAKDGDIAARNRLVMEGRKEVSKASWKYKGRDINRDPEDIAQDSFLKLLTGVYSYDGISSVRTFAYSTARNMAFDLYRKEKIRRHAYLDDSIAQNDERIYDLPDFEDLISKIKDPMQRMILTLRFKENKTYKEISDFLNIHFANRVFYPMKVSRTLNRSLNKLRFDLKTLVSV